MSINGVSEGKDRFGETGIPLHGDLERHTVLCIFGVKRDYCFMGFTACEIEVLYEI